MEIATDYLAGLFAFRAFLVRVDLYVHCEIWHYGNRTSLGVRVFFCDKVLFVDERSLFLLLSCLKLVVLSGCYWLKP